MFKEFSISEKGFDEFVAKDSSPEEKIKTVRLGEKSILVIATRIDNVYYELYCYNQNQASLNENEVYDSHSRNNFLIGIYTFSNWEEALNFFDYDTEDFDFEGFLKKNPNDKNFSKRFLF